MKIKDLLMTAAFLTMSGVTMAQTTITAGNVKKVSGEEARLSYYYTNSKAMGGFQMVVSLPDGVTLEENEGKTELNINGSTAPADFFNVTVPSGFECIGVKADVAGVTSDGTSYDAGDVLLVCLPVKGSAVFKATETASRLCTLTLKTSTGITEDVFKTIKINGFAGSDSKGTGGETSAQYAASEGSVVSPAKVLKAGDVNGDSSIDALDIQDVISTIVAGGFTDDANVNGDDVVDALDIQDVISTIVGQ